MSWPWGGPVTARDPKGETKARKLENLPTPFQPGDLLPSGHRSDLEGQQMFRVVYLKVHRAHYTLMLLEKWKRELFGIGKSCPYLHQKGFVAVYNMKKKLEKCRSRPQANKYNKN